MNLYGRFLLSIISMCFNHHRFDPFEPVRLHFRVWPHDIDINVHLTAARYLSFGDFGRMQWLANNQLLWPFVRKGFKGVLNAQEITYIREFKPFSRVDIAIELKCWDDKYGYFEQRFYCKGKLHAVSHARLAILHNQKVVSFDQVFQRLGYVIHNQPETEAITDWKATLKAKRAHFS